MPTLQRLFSIDYRSLAALRIFCAVTLIYVAIVLYPDLMAFFSDSGLLSFADVQTYYPDHRLTLFGVLNGPVILYLSWGVMVLFAIFLLLGYRSRLSATVCLILYLSFIGRNPVMVNGGDTLLPLLLFWLVFLPAGRVFAIDGALDPQRRNAEDNLCFSLATVGLLLQVVYVYFFGALLKTSGIWIPSGAAVYIALHLDSFVTPLGILLRDMVPVTIFLTYFVYCIELFAPVLLFYPDRDFVVRNLTLWLLIIMHLGFKLTLSIEHFWLASISSLMAFVPITTWHCVNRHYWKAHQSKIRIYYDRDCGFCLKTCLLLREFFLPHDVVIAPAQDSAEMGELLAQENSWIVVTPDGRRLLHWDALVYVTGRSWLLRPVWLLAWSIGKLGLGRVLYTVIGNNRIRLGKATTLLLPYRRQDNRLNVPTRFVLTVIIVLCFWWNVEETLPDERRSPVYYAVGPVMNKLGLGQRWRMFSPMPSLSDGYPIVMAHMEDGRQAYLFGDQLMTEKIRPARLEAYYASHRWRKYMNRAGFYGDERLTVLFQNYAEMICRQLVTETDFGQVASVEMHMAVNTSINQPEDEYTEYRIGQWVCG